jgi:23S rRNA (adenine2503-C2)-methyltransferase
VKILAVAGREDVALVSIADFGGGRILECVESLQPPLPRERKWVLLVSTMFGCPIGCPMCDAGGSTRGRVSREDILAQIDYLVDGRYPGRVVPCRQFKIQFARMGEPALNEAVLDVLEELPRRYRAAGLMPAVSTVAPAGTEPFFERLAGIKDRLYAGGHFQFQFSIHSTDPRTRDRLIPCRKWDFERMARYGERFVRPGDRKIALNFALVRGAAVDAAELRRHFDPRQFLVKITPVNPTFEAAANGLDSAIDPFRPEETNGIAAALEGAGYEVIVSIGEPEENRIGSNCGQYVRTHLKAGRSLGGGYTYPLRPAD